MQTHGGKGSTPRPVNKEKFDANWDRIFGGSEMKVSVTWGEICAKGLVMEVIELKHWDIHGAQNVPTDEVIELTVKQAQNLGLLSEE